MTFYIVTSTTIVTQPLLRNVHAFNVKLNIINHFASRKKKLKTIVVSWDEK